MLDQQTTNFTGDPNAELISNFQHAELQCEQQHIMYSHLDEFYNSFNGTNSTPNLSTLLRHDPCYLPSSWLLEQPSSWLIELDFWCSGILINLIGMVGILGNSLSLIILSRPQMRSSINYLLIALARCDIILIITSMFLFGFHSIYPYSYNDDTGGSMFWFRYTYNVYPRIIKYLFTLAVIAQTANCYLTLLVSLERYVAVCHPLRAVSITFFHRLIYWSVSLQANFLPILISYIILYFLLSFLSLFNSILACTLHIWSFQILRHFLHNCGHSVQSSAIWGDWIMRWHSSDLWPNLLHANNTIAGKRCIHQILYPLELFGGQ